MAVGLLGALGGLILLYLLCCIVLHFWSYKPLYKPKKSSYIDGSLEGFVKLTTSSGTQLSALHLFNPQATHTILFSHGNGSDLGRILPHLEELRRHGYSVFAYDYPGYGTSEGSPSEAALYEAIHTAYDHMVENLELTGEQIILLGRSLGGGPATELAQHKPAAGLILESTFISVYRTKTKIPLFWGDKFNNLKKISKLDLPLLIIHGTEDRLISFSSAERLYHSATGPKQYLWVQGAGHYDYQTDNVQYWSHVRGFSGWAQSHWR